MWMNTDIDTVPHGMGVWERRNKNEGTRVPLHVHVQQKQEQGFGTCTRGIGDESMKNEAMGMRTGLTN